MTGEQTVALERDILHAPVTWEEMVMVVKFDLDSWFIAMSTELITDGHRYQ